MKLDIFRPSDFRSPNSDGSFCIEEFIYQAHKILSERGQVFYIDLTRDTILARQTNDCTHQGLLIGVCEIEKECVEHEPTVNYSFGIYDTTKPVCKICGKKLKAKWSLVE